MKRLAPRVSVVSVRSGARQGMTLMELLVVVSILLILTVVAVPMITPSAESRRMREAARQINVYLGIARAKAMETSRAHGVIFKRESGLNQACTTLFLAEVPPPYAGDTFDTKLQLQSLGGGQYRAYKDPNDTNQWINQDLVEVGDLIQFRGQGPMYRIAAMQDLGGNPDLDQLTLTLDQPTWVAEVPWPSQPSYSPPMAFQIFRQPVPTMAESLQLPTSIAIDTRWSGIGTDASGNRTDTFRPADDADNEPVIVMFSPKGEVERVYCRRYSTWPTGTWEGGRPVEPLYLLVGRQERVATTVTNPPAPEDGLWNWQDTTNLWIAINPQTGLVRAMEVANAASLVDSRRIARTGQSMGGK